MHTFPFPNRVIPPYSWDRLEPVLRYKEMTFSRKPFAIFLILSTSLFVAAALGAAPGVKLTQSAHQVSIEINGQPFSIYYYNPEAPKPYLHPLRTAEGIIVTRGFPMR